MGKIYWRSTFILYGLAMLLDGLSILITLGHFCLNLTMKYVLWEYKRTKK